MDSRYCGCWTALVTPFDNDYKVNWSQLEKNVRFQSEQGVTGVLPMGSTGESATVTHREHSKVIENTVGYADGKTKVLAGTGSNSTDEAIFETKRAVEAGVETCLLVDCYYNKPSSLELRREYYEPVLSEFPETDFIAYAIPGRSVTVISPEDLALIRAGHKNLVAVKEATGDFERMRKTRELADDDFNIISGDDPNTYEMMTDARIMSSGVISVISNITPAAIERYVRMILEGKAEEAKAVDESLQPLFNVVGVKTVEEVALPDGSTSQVEYRIPNPVPVKTMMAGLGMIAGTCKRPLGKLTAKGVESVREALKSVWEGSPEVLEPIQGFYDVDIPSRLDDDNIWSKLSY
ncbi:MAG: 4-hydroxy-tetrahydrodipicolinate synthase [Candidatus Altiarchaeales archaeon]|nr:4-hydroxy-tetrahydrodipicolinate synthase [Candidatus Altiarchaeales archaeon]MBD3415926.1 4-hydroxy-tetrahydrodipicolinate synthase [Candidatus Altiarchaeales archaeon]